MSCHERADDDYSSSDSEPPSTEGELLEEKPKDFVVVIERLNEYGIIPSQSIKSKDIECFVYNPIPIHIKAQEQTMVSVGISIRVLNNNYCYHIKQHSTLKNNNIVIIAYIYDPETSELKLILKNIDKKFERRILRGEKIARVVFKKQQIKDIKFIIH